MDAGVPQWPASGLGDGTHVGDAYTGDVNLKLDVWRALLAAEINRLWGAVGRK
jgi:hypothetical protein